MTEEKPKKIITIKTGDMINEQYKVNNYLGQGGFGAVFDVIDIQTNELYALKVTINKMSIFCIFHIIVFR